MNAVDLLIIGAGDRGTTYARLATAVSPAARIVGVADPREPYRQRLASRHAVDPSRVYSDWREALDAERFADAVVVATPDRLHLEPALAALERGYHLLLEKPMATSIADCEAIADAAEASESIVCVGHVLRYTDYTRKVKLLVDSGILGEVMAIQRLEPVGFDHFAHSYVRGNWRREEEAAAALLTKCCHDLDWLRYVVGRPVVSVASFGVLKHFRPEARPTGAADRCLQCAIERRCPYSALRCYLDRAMVGERGWPLDVVTPDATPQRIVEALATSPYGRCVYACDNDVVDTQVVTLAFEGGALATLTMTAFAPMGLRETSVFGSLGRLMGDGTHIDHDDFLSGTRTSVGVTPPDAAGAGDLAGHGGGDLRLVQSFIKAVVSGDRSSVLSSPVDVLESHLVAFAAERARRTASVVRLTPTS